MENGIGGNSESPSIGSSYFESLGLAPNDLARFETVVSVIRGCEDALPSKEFIIKRGHMDGAIFDRFVSRLTPEAGKVLEEEAWITVKRMIGNGKFSRCVRNSTGFAPVKKARDRGMGQVEAEEILKSEKLPSNIAIAEKMGIKRHILKGLHERLRSYGQEYIEPVIAAHAAWFRKFEGDELRIALNGLAFPTLEILEGADRVLRPILDRIVDETKEKVTDSYLSIKSGIGHGLIMGFLGRNPEFVSKMTEKNAKNKGICTGYAMEAARELGSLFPWSRPVIYDSSPQKFLIRAVEEIKASGGVPMFSAVGRMEDKVNGKPVTFIMVFHPFFEMHVFQSAVKKLAKNCGIIFAVPDGIKLSEWTLGRYKERGFEWKKVEIAPSGIETGSVWAEKEIEKKPVVFLVLVKTSDVVRGTFALPFLNGRLSHANDLKERALHVHAEARKARLGKADGRLAIKKPQALNTLTFTK